MCLGRPRLWQGWVLAAAFLSIAAKGISFDDCFIRISSIQAGNLTYDGIDNGTIDEFIHHGPITGLDPGFPREDILAIPTTCVRLCNDPVDWYWNADIPMVLSIVSNWILPIFALTATLPFDSLHRRNDGASWAHGRISRTLGALSIWYGSPPVALTATLFNIHQIRKCSHATRSAGSGVSGNTEKKTLKEDAYYVLCCLGQYKLDVPEGDRDFLETLIYGLLMPICDVTVGEAAQSNHPQSPAAKDAELWTKELLQQMAFQLRMLRRRGLYPTIISVLLFFVAYAIAITQAFSSMGERTSTHSLALGILISWSPLLVLFALLDRNPNSADRSRTLLARWLWNVHAIKYWHQKQQQPQQRDSSSPTDPDWWQQSKENEVMSPGHLQPYQLRRLYFGTYIAAFEGQGRQPGYHGLAYAVLVSMYDSAKDNRRVQPLKVIVDQTLRHLYHRPGSWWWIASVSLAVVWLQIGMAFMLSYNIPTVGIGCRAASYLVYGVLCTLPWVLHLAPNFKSPSAACKSAVFALCILATLCLVFINLAAFSGVLNNCFCRGGMSGYLDFMNAEFYRKYFHVDRVWIAAAVVGALPVVGALLATMILLFKLKSLWHASEQSNPVGGDASADMTWIA